MISSVKLYKVIALGSFLILLSVQFFLVYNTYKLKDEHFFFQEKNVINDFYSRSIRNDKVFPGAQNIIDKYIYANMPKLESLYNAQPKAFDVYKQKVCDSMFKELRTKSVMNTLFHEIVKTNQLNKNLQYQSLIQSISITFSGQKYIPIYQKGKIYPFIDKDLQTSAGIPIAGTLKSLTNQNLITSVNVSSPSDHSYQISFALFVDTPDRYLAILKLMEPTFFLSLFSILVVVLIYFFTFRNWINQKKFADMTLDFVHRIRHEFHTPLATIIIANKNLQNEKIVEKKDSIKPLTSIIERQSARLKSLFDSVLNLTSITESTLEKHEYELYTLLEEILVDYRLKIKDSKTEIQFLMDNENRIVYLDRFWFTTMVFNIFDNGIKYNQSSIKIIRIEVKTLKKNIEIHISDNGIGISSKSLSRIFDKFYREDKLKTEKGLGLGLYYTKQAVNAHGWQMEVKRKELTGSEFIIYIPVEPQNN